MLSFDELAPLLGDYAVRDVPCPACSAQRQPNHRRLPVMRLWRVDQGMLSFYCAHCEASGYVKADDDPRPSSKTLALARQMAREDPAVSRVDKGYVGGEETLGPMSDQASQLRRRQKGLDLGQVGHGENVFLVHGRRLQGT